MRAERVARRRRSALAAIGLLFWAGCDAVREDRTINISPSGNQVAFQHGEGGIFIADPRTGELHRVFDPDRSIVAVSSPLWSADESRDLHDGPRRTADRASGRSSRRKWAFPPPIPRALPMAASRQRLPSIGMTHPRDVTSAAARGLHLLANRAGSRRHVSKSPSRCSRRHAGHAGYVAGNWAVRQSPKGESILFVDQEVPQGHAVWSFDIKSAKKSRVFPPAGIAARATCWRTSRRTVRHRLHGRTRHGRAGGHGGAAS